MAAYNSMVMKQRLLIITILLLAAVSIGLGGLYIDARRESHTTTTPYPLLAKRLFLENPDDVIINFQPLREKVRTYLDSSGATYSFYFEYLFTGSNIRAGDNNKLVGASLMKIPVVMDLYKTTEQGKLNLDDMVPVASLDNTAGTDEEFGNQRSLRAGQKISLRDAAKTALVESDNTAAFTIFEATKDKLPEFDQAINNLDVETQVGETNQVKYALISARSYTSLLKCLYFSCFLAPNDSQDILNQLTHSEDSNRIRAGVPKGVPVASKIGSFSNITQSDCGIVYAANRRYTLCIMLDEDSKTADTHIKELSKMVYDYVIQAN